MTSEEFFEMLISHHFGPFTGVPCSLVKDLIELAEHSTKTQYYKATSEGEAMGIAGGLSLSGRFPVTIFQNDGLGNAVNPLTSLQMVYRLPVLMLITWRGDPEGDPDEPQHRIMGKVLLDLLDLLGIAYRVLTTDNEQIREDVANAAQTIKDEAKPFALVIRRGLFFQCADAHQSGDTEVRRHPLRIDYIKGLRSMLGHKDLVLATTGFTGREMVQEIGHHGQFYMAGSMGCVTSLGLGIALENADRRVIVLDGDGALLMKMGTLATIGYYQPRNLIHIVFDNGVYESTGCQETASPTVNIAQIALNCGYQWAESLDTIDNFMKFLKDSLNIAGPKMCHIKVRPGTVDGLKRLQESAFEHRNRFMVRLSNSEHFCT